MRLLKSVFGGIEGRIFALILLVSGLAGVGIGLAAFFITRSTLNTAGAIVIIVGITLVILLLALLFSWRISKSLPALEEGDERVGLGELEYCVDIKAGEELQSLARSFNSMAEAIKRSRLKMEHRTRERTEELQALNEMITSLGRKASPDKILQSSLGIFMELIGYEIGCSYLADDEGWKLLYHRCPGDYKGHIPQFIAAGAGVLGKMVEEGEAVFIGDVEEFAGQGASYGHPQGSLAALPLRSSSRILGVFLLASSKTAPLAEESKRILRVMADEVGMALENAILYSELRNHVAVLERANRELRGLDEMKSNFISAVTHELKQPLALIGGYAQTIYDYYESLTYEEEMHCLRVIMERTQFLTDLVEDLLDLSMLEMGRIRLQCEELDLVALARKAVEEQDMGGKELKMSLDFPDDFPVVIADARRMEQVISNLISNAIKFSESQGEVKLSGRVFKDRVQVRVEDQGVGIDPFHLERIFERFYQADASTRRPYPGVGLGLFICRQLVEAHKGLIWAENRPEGGSAFTFEIPQTQDKGGKNFVD